jgi:hypothetical protein
MMLARTIGFLLPTIERLVNAPSGPRSNKDAVRPDQTREVSTFP